MNKTFVSKSEMVWIMDMLQIIMELIPILKGID